MNWYKKLFSVGIASALSLSSLPVLSNDTNEDSTLLMCVDSYAAYKNGVYTQIDESSYQVTPIIVNDRTLIPARFFSEAFDCKVLWDGKTRTVTISNDEHTIEAVIDNKTLDIDGDTIEIDTPAQLINGRTMLPLRALAEALE